MPAAPSIERLVAIMAALRTPGTGCPWDLAQTSASIAPYAIEEAYEVVDAIERRDTDDTRDELGDLLLQVVFHARMAEEAGSFRFDDVVEGVCAKMLRRHPHVFGTAGRAEAQGGSASWEAIKAEERRERAQRGGSAAAGASALADVPVALPGLTCALKLQQKASGVGFDWHDVRAVLAKIREETDEIEAELDRADTVALAGEVGDLLFAVVNLARHAGIDPESAVRRTNGKFERRFAFIEEALARRGLSPAEAGLAAMDSLWNQAKAQGL